MSRKVTNGLDLLTTGRVVNMQDPTNPQDGATKNYVDNVVNGVSWKLPVRAASTGNITLTAPGTTIDGVTMANGDRFLAKDQTTPSQNGIYVFNGSAATATRSTDADNSGSSSEVRSGIAVFVTEGTVNADKAYVLTTTGAITLGTTSLTFAQFGGGVSYTAGNGINISSNVISVNPAASGGITVAAGGVSVDHTKVPYLFSTTIGDGSSTTLTVTHNLGTRAVQVTVYDSSTFDEVTADVNHATTNTVTVAFATAPASGAYTVVVFG
jgi:hypothetical protein